MLNEYLKAYGIVQMTNILIRFKKKKKKKKTTTEKHTPPSNQIPKMRKGNIKIRQKCKRETAINSVITRVVSGTPQPFTSSPLNGCVSRSTTPLNVDSSGWLVSRRHPLRGCCAHWNQVWQPGSCLSNFHSLLANLPCIARVYKHLPKQTQQRFNKWWL